MANNIQSGLSLIDGFRLARNVGRHLKDGLNYTAEEFIAIAENALRTNPKEWVVLYGLGDKYQEVGRFADSIKVLGECVEIRPKDIRATFLLATGYNLLTRAVWTQEDAEKRNVEMRLTGYDRIDPEHAKNELKKANLSLETAASQAIRWFEKALTLNPDRQSISAIQFFLEDLYNKFPNLRH